MKARKESEINLSVITENQIQIEGCAYISAKEIIQCFCVL